MRLIDADKLKENARRCDDSASRATFDFVYEEDIDDAPTVDAIPLEKIKLLGEEHRKFREGITDEKVLIGYNMTIAICNKYLGESEVENEKIS